MSETKPIWWNGPWKAVETRVYFPSVIGGFDVRGCPDPERLAGFLAAAPDLYDRLLASNVALTAVLDRVGEGFADELRHEIAKNRRALSAARGTAQSSDACTFPECECAAIHLCKFDRPSAARGEEG